MVWVKVCDIHKRGSVRGASDSAEADGEPDIVWRWLEEDDYHRQQERCRWQQHDNLQNCNCW